MSNLYMYLLCSDMVNKLLSLSLLESCRHVLAVRLHQAELNLTISKVSVVIASTARDMGLVTLLHV